MGFEPTMPLFERSKTVRALDNAATGTGLAFKCFYTVVVEHEKKIQKYIEIRQKLIKGG
jgi:hypothetical protein